MTARLQAATVPAALGDLADVDGTAIRARGLDVGYGGQVVVPGVDLELNAGGSLALVGTNGSGKSTLIKTLVGLLPPAGGSVEVLGAAPGKAPGRIAYHAQFHSSGYILPIRVIDVVRMARYPSLGLLQRLGSRDHELVEQGMARMGITHLAQAPMRSLSGGQLQRVYLAQVLARQADLIVVDEPTAGIDAGGRELYLDAFAAELRRGAAIVTATHDIAEAVEYDQVLLLARRVIALGPGSEVLTPDQLMETFGIVIRDPHAEHAGRFTVAEVAHGQPQTIETRCQDEEEGFVATDRHDGEGLR
ncbi:MAG: metal ABC transporter ATP-binding protein [Candidatus Limnocylindrales bacterium]